MGSKRKNKYPDELVIRVINEILIVENHPRLMVLVGNGFYEILINILVSKKLKNGSRIESDSRSYSYAVRLVILHEAGVISDKEFKTLDWYRNIRNRAAHEPLFEIAKKDFDALGNPNYSSPESLSRLTIDLLGQIWNENTEIFSPLFGAVPVRP